MYNDGYMLSFPMEQTMTSWSQFKSGKWCGDGGLNSILLIYNGSSQKWAPTHLGSVGSKFPVATRTLNWPQDSVAISCVLLRIRDGHRPELEPKSRLDFGSWNSRPWNSHVLMFGCLDPWHTSATSSPQGSNMLVPFPSNADTSGAKPDKTQKWHVLGGNMLMSLLDDINWQEVPNATQKWSKLAQVGDISGLRFQFGVQFRACLVCKLQTRLFQSVPISTQNYHLYQDADRMQSCCFHRISLWPPVLLIKYLTGPSLSPGTMRYHVTVVWVLTRGLLSEDSTWRFLLCCIATGLWSSTGFNIYVKLIGKVIKRFGQQYTNR